MKRKVHTAEFKAKVSLEAVKSGLNANLIASTYEIHAVQVGQWKKELLANLASIFEGKRTQPKSNEEHENPAKLYEQIGRLKVEVDWLKENLNYVRLKNENSNRRVIVMHEVKEKMKVGSSKSAYRSRFLTTKSHPLV